MTKRKMFGRVMVVTATAALAVTTVGIQPANAVCATDYQADLAGSGATSPPPPGPVQYSYQLDHFVDVSSLTVYGGNIIDAGVGLAVVPVQWAGDVAVHEIGSMGAVTTATTTFVSCVA